MEIKIRDMLQGGYMPPFTYYQPVLVNDLTTKLYAYNIGGDGIYSSSRSSKSSSSKSDDDNKGRLTEKDLMAMLEKVDGLPSDMKHIFSELMEFQLLSDIPFVSSMIGDLSTQYISTLQNIKTANFNKGLFDNAYELLSKKDALNEIAINKDGTVWIEDPETGKPTQVSVDEYATGKYKAYTNSNLLYLRANVLPNDNSIFDITDNAISMKEINDLIHDYLSQLGTSENSTSTYEKKMGQKIQQGIENIYSVEDEVSESGVDGLYKSKNLTKQQKIQGSLAIEYIWNMLPKNAQTLLKIKAKQMGAKTDDVLVRLFVGSSLSDTTENTDTLVLDAEGKKLGSKSSTGTSGLRYKENDPVTAFINGSGYEQNIQINPGSSVPYIVKARMSLLTQDKKEFSPNSSFINLLSSDFKSILDTDNATFGGQLINGNRNLMLILDADIARVDLPIDEEAFKKGVIKPDFDLSFKVEEAESQIHDLNITDEEEINTIYKSLGLPEKFRKTNGGWNLNTLNYQSFALLKGRADENAMSNKNIDTRIAKIIDNDNTEEEMENVFKNNDKHYSRGAFLALGGGSDYYEGFIFIPIRDSLVLASFGTSDYYEWPNKDTNTTIEREDLRLRYIQSPTLDELN